jgi:hypothetical protein
MELRECVINSYEAQVAVVRTPSLSGRRATHCHAVVREVSWLGLVCIVAHVRGLMHVQAFHGLTGDPVTRVCAMAFAVVARLIYDTPLARMFPGQ